MKNINPKFMFSGLIAILCLLCWSSCKTDQIKPVTEPAKDLTGTWKIIKATRNGTDLIGLVDSNVYSFNKFSIIFKSGSYTVANPLPFIVSQNGTYALDNPQYPFKITFNQTGSTTPVSTAFTYPIVNGVRVLTLVFSPGCAQNTYSYSLVKVSN
jgi:hypothetical protein